MPNTAPAIEALYAEGTGALPSANAVGRAGVFYRIPAAGALSEQIWVTTNLTPTTYQWTELSLSSDNELGNYWVAPPGAGRVNAPYTTIQAAIAASVADGHTSATGGANIYITPGTYVENPVLFSGTNLIGVNAPNPMDITQSGAATNWSALRPVVQGSISCDVGCNIASVQNLRVFSNGAPAITIGAIATANFGVYGCSLEVLGVASVLVSSSSAACRLGIFECQLQNFTTQAGIAGINLTTAHFLSVLDSSIRSNVGSDTAISFGAASTFTAQRMRTLGVLSFVAGATVANLEDCDHVVAGANAYINVAAGGPTISWTRGSMSGSTAAPNIAGTLTLIRSGAQGSDANGLQLSATVTPTITRSLGIPRTSRANGAADLTAANFLLADHHTLNTSAAARGVALPVGATYPPGQLVGISADQTGGAGANAITVTPNGAETINGLNAAVVCAASVKGCCSLMRDPDLATNWILVSIT